MSEESLEDPLDRFLRAVHDRDAELLERCLAEGFPCSDRESTEGGAFQTLAQDNWIEGLEIAYRHSKDIDGPNVIGATPLQMAVREGNVDVAKWFLGHGANPNAPGCHGATALTFAATEASITGKRGLLDLLVAHGAVHDIYSCVCLGELEPVREFLMEHPDAVKQSPNRFALVNEAVSAWRYRVERGLPHGVAVDEKEFHGLSDLLELLIRHGANIDDRDNSQTALHKIASCNTSSPHLIKLLIEMGADVNAQDSDGRTPLDLALWVYAPFADLLRAHGAVSVSPAEDSAEYFNRRFEELREFYEKNEGEAEK